jgi:hypothetical protein
MGILRWSLIIISTNYKNEDIIGILRMLIAYASPIYLLIYWGLDSIWIHSALWLPIGLLCQSRVIIMMEKLVEWWLAGEIEVTRRKPAPVPLCPPQNPHAARIRTRAAAVGSQRLTAWATPRTFPEITDRFGCVRGLRPMECRWKI